jgi:hypothetical protein
LNQTYKIKETQDGMAFTFVILSNYVKNTQMNKILVFTMSVMILGACGDTGKTTPAQSDSVPPGADSVNVAPVGGAPTMGTGDRPGVGVPADTSQITTDSSGR